MKCRRSWPNICRNEKYIKEPCQDKDGNLQWYPDRYFFNGDIQGSFRHVDGVFASYKDSLIDGMCSFCASLEKLGAY